MESRDRVLEQLKKLDLRLSGKTVNFPADFENNKCPTCGGPLDFQLAGLFLKMHIGMFMDAIRRMD